MAKSQKTQSNHLIENRNSSTCLHERDRSEAAISGYNYDLGALSFSQEE